MTSRFITYPDLVESTENHSVLLIDATQYNIEDIGLFCKISESDFDVYLYRHEISDLQWLNEVHNRVSIILLSEDSNVTITPDSNIIKFGKHQQLVNPLTYFQNFETNFEENND